MQEIRAQEIAAWLGGELIGADVAVNQVGTLLAGQKNAVGFLAEEKYRSQLSTTQLGLILLAEPEADLAASQIVVADVRRAWRILTERFQAEMDAARPQGIHPQAVVAANVQMGPNVSIGAGAVIESGAILAKGVRIEALAYVGRGVEIGADTHIGAGVKILSGTRIGERCRILANAVIGERGFGNHFEDGRWLEIPQLGGVLIGNDVEIGAATMIDRGAVGDTIIGNGVKLDNLIQVAHNVEIGDHSAIAGCCVIAGSVKFGKYCVVGGASVFTGHITICDSAQFTGHSSVSKSITEAGMYCSAMTVMPIKQWKRFLAKLRIFGKEK